MSDTKAPQRKRRPRRARADAAPPSDGVTAPSDGAPAPSDGVTAPTASAPAPLDAEGMRRPSFVTHFPADPALDELVRAFEVGDYLAVRRGAPALARDTTDPAVRGAARELLRRIEPDPLVRVLFAVAAALLMFLIVWGYFVHTH